MNSDKFRTVTDSWHLQYVESQQLAGARKIIYRGLIVSGIILLLGIGAMIYIGETTLWATEETKAGFPTLEIRP